MPLDALMLSRLQFAFTIAFHYLFPPLTIGLGVLLVMMETMFHRTRLPIYGSMARFWTKIFAVNFAMGVATGIVMEFEFGTNWATYSRFVGDVFGSALAAEGIFAFFLESGFLAVLVFGWDRVSPRMHLFSTVMVALGGIFSSIWITVANSWQQTPAGHHLVGEGLMRRAEIVDFWAMVFNPSSVPRLLHVWTGSFLLGAFFVMSISAWYLLRRRHEEFARRSFTLALALGTVGALAAPLTGDIQGKVVAKYQPAKLAAFEGHFHTGEGPAPLYLIGWPDVEAQQVRYGIAIPGLLSFLAHGDLSTPVTGLDRIPRDEWPPVEIPFLSFHLMVGLGLTMLGLVVLAHLLRFGGRLWRQRWLLWVFVFAVLAPYAANLLGWTAAEVGRQPWVVYGLLRTADGLSKSVAAEHVLASILMFGVIYALLFAVWVYVLNDKIQHGPEELTADEPRYAGRGLLATITGLADRSGPSLTQVRKWIARRGPGGKH
ncbi:MAG: cytochrome ubiquinol oxidase subunit I [Candidatus Eisenbacteria bacterium]|nr:cytochrome ubiquinol oxidase subunit I [Candidatus Eisenbacteria bacterium]MCC7141478.1 cytochrome ubiquinol oxidase subunit I [Candidatus Eisenbacteria bacterium]